jgi:energy-converting hydrogenase Eha subunit E
MNRFELLVRTVSVDGAVVGVHRIELTHQERLALITDSSARTGRVSVELVAALPLGAHEVPATGWS